MAILSLMASNLDSRAKVDRGPGFMSKGAMDKSSDA